MCNLMSLDQSDKIYFNQDMHIKRDATRQQSSLIFINFRLLLCIPDVTCTSKNTQIRHIYDDSSVTSTTSTSVTQIAAFLFSAPCPLQIICLWSCLSPSIRSLCFRSICALYSSRARCAARLSRSPRGLVQKSTRPESEWVNLIIGAVT